MPVGAETGEGSVEQLGLAEIGADLGPPGIERVFRRPLNEVPEADAAMLSVGPEGAA